MTGTQYRYIVDRAAKASPGQPLGSRPIVCISRQLFDALPDGTLLYDTTGRSYHKGRGAMANIEHNPSLTFTAYGVANFGFPATAADLQQSGPFTGPYRDR